MVRPSEHSLRGTRKRDPTHDPRAGGKTRASALGAKFEIEAAKWLPSQPKTWGLGLARIARIDIFTSEAETISEAAKATNRDQPASTAVRKERVIYWYPRGFHPDQLKERGQTRRPFSERRQTRRP